MKELTVKSIKLWEDNEGRVLFATWETTYGMVRVKLFAPTSPDTVNLTTTEERAVEWALEGSISQI